MQRDLKSSARNSSDARKITECSLNGKMLTTRKTERKDPGQLVTQIEPKEGRVTVLAEEIQLEAEQLEDREAAEEVHLLFKLSTMHQKAVDKATTRRARTWEELISRPRKHISGMFATKLKKVLIKNGSALKMKEKPENCMMNRKERKLACYIIML